MKNYRQHKLCAHGLHKVGHRRIARPVEQPPAAFTLNHLLVIVLYPILV